MGCIRSIEMPWNAPEGLPQLREVLYCGGVVTYRAAPPGAPLLCTPGSSDWVRPWTGDRPPGATSGRRPVSWARAGQGGVTADKRVGFAGRGVAHEMSVGLIPRITSSELRTNSMSEAYGLRLVFRSEDYRGDAIR